MDMMSVAPQDYCAVIIVYDVSFLIIWHYPHVMYKDGSNRYNQSRLTCSVGIAHLFLD